MSAGALLPIGVPIAIFTLIVLALSGAVLAARRRLAPDREVHVTVNGQRQVAVASGDKLLTALAGQGVFLPAACGGRGSCGQCRVTVLSGGGGLLPTEANHISRADAAAGVRLACMVTVREPLAIRLPPALLEARRWRCRVRSNRNLATYLKELVLELPAGDAAEFEAGEYVLLEAPPQRIRFADLELQPDQRSEWEGAGFLGLEVEIAEPTVRAYSLANPPAENHTFTLVVRVATPPPHTPRGTPPGKVSSYVFSLKPGDTVTVSGPFGDFHARDSGREMVLVGGGAGIAPMRSVILDQLEGKKTDRKISFWYGARNRRELCYAKDFEGLAARHDNFSYHAALSEPRPDDGWSGPTGLIHSVVYERYLREHPCPEELEYYLCGPPLMASAVLAMLEDLGVDRDSVLFDDFGS